MSSQSLISLEYWFDIFMIIIRDPSFTESFFKLLTYLHAQPHLFFDYDWGIPASTKKYI